MIYIKHIYIVQPCVACNELKQRLFSQHVLQPPGARRKVRKDSLWKQLTTRGMDEERTFTPGAKNRKQVLGCFGNRRKHGKNGKKGYTFTMSACYLLWLLN